MAIPNPIETYLKQQGVRYVPITHAPAYTAQEEAAATHVPGREWAKTIACFADDELVLAVLPAHLAVDTDALRKLAGARKVRLAQESEFAGRYADCEVGAMPPLGPLYQQRVFVDERLAADAEIVFHAGTHTDAVRMRYEDFAAIVKPTVGVFGRLPAV